MADLTKAREALAARDRTAKFVGYSDQAICDHLRSALAEVDRLTAEVERLTTLSHGTTQNAVNERRKS